MLVFLWNKKEYSHTHTHTHVVGIHTVANWVFFIGAQAREMLHPIFRGIWVCDVYLAKGFGCHTSTSVYHLAQAKT